MDMIVPKARCMCTHQFSVRSSPAQNARPFAFRTTTRGVLAGWGTCEACVYERGVSECCLLDVTDVCSRHLVVSVAQAAEVVQQLVHLNVAHATIHESVCSAAQWACVRDVDGGCARWADHRLVERVELAGPVQRQCVHLILRFNHNSRVLHICTVPRGLDVSNAGRVCVCAKRARGSGVRCVWCLERGLCHLPRNSVQSGQAW